jgi:hypothetical protein
MSLAFPAVALDPGPKCASKKMKEVGKFYFCRMKAEALFAKTGDASKLGDKLLKCEQKFAGKWGKWQLDGALECPKADNDRGHTFWVEYYNDAIAQSTDHVAASLSLDGSLESANMPYPRLPATGQTTCYDPTGGTANTVSCTDSGQDGETQAGASDPLLVGTNSIDGPQVTNKTGIIIDPRTGLMWEAKDDNNAGGIHDVDNLYTFADAVDPNGPFLDVLNNRCWQDESVDCTAGGDSACTTVAGDKCGLGGYRDWRAPNVKELQSIIDYEVSAPAVDLVFNSGCIPGCDIFGCSCTASSFYWSSTSIANNPTYAWFVGFYAGYVYDDYKGYTEHVRAVRGGS